MSGTENLRELTKEELDAEFQAFVDSLDIRPPQPPKFKDGDEHMTDDDDDKENIDQDELECDEPIKDVYQ